MEVFQIVLFLFLIVCAISVTFSKNLLNSIIIFMSYSLIMSIIWILLESPDLAITEAAVGAGITSILFLSRSRRFTRSSRWMRTRWTSIRAGIHQIKRGEQNESSIIRGGIPENQGV